MILSEVICACVSIFFAIASMAQALDDPTTWNVGMSVMWIIITVFWFVYFFVRNHNKP